MFTDIVGYTKLMGEDEQAAFELLKKNRAVQRPIIEKFNGRWLRASGCNCSKKTARSGSYQIGKAEDRVKPKAQRIFE